MRHPRFIVSFWQSVQSLMENSIKFSTDTPSQVPHHPSSIRNNKDQRYGHINRHRAMSSLAPDPRLQAVPGYFYCACGCLQCLYAYHQQPYPQFDYSSPYQFSPHFCPHISPYGQLCNHPSYTLSPFRYLVGFHQNLQENVGQGDQRLATAKISVRPPGGIIKEGQFFFSNKVYIQLSLEQQVRLGAVNPGTQNKCRKIRPWLVLWKLDNGNVIVV